MEYAQLESRISFLDNQYRREKSDLAQLRHQLDLSEAEKAEMGKRIEDLEGELLEVKSKLPKIELLESIIERFKGEMLSALEEQRGRQKQSLKDAERSRSIEMETQVKAIHDLREEIQRTRNLDELITLARTETERQGAMFVSFQQRLDMLTKENDERLRAVSYLEEQRRSDTRRLSEVKSETADLFKRTALQLSKIELLEQQIPQFGQFQTELEKVREKVRIEVEKAQYQHAQVQRTVKSWDSLAETLQRRLDEYEGRMERYAEHYQRNLKALEALQGFQEQLQRDQHEFKELHRLNFDRQTTQVEEWQAMQEQSIYKHTLENKQTLSEMQRKIDKVEVRTEEVAEPLPDFKSQIDLLLKIAEEDALSRAIAARDWQQRFEQLATEGSE